MQRFPRLGQTNPATSSSVSSPTSSRTAGRSAAFIFAAFALSSLTGTAGEMPQPAPSGDKALATIAAAALPTPLPAEAEPEAAVLPRVRLYFLWGQSHMGGGRSVKELTGLGLDWANVNPFNPHPYPVVKDAYIYDKSMRGRTTLNMNGTVNGTSSRKSGLYWESTDGTDSTGPISGTQQAHPVEEFSLRNLTAGYAGAVRSDAIEGQIGGPFATFGPYGQQFSWYPWERATQQAVSNPSFGPEMSFASNVQKSTQEIVIISKFAVGGTNLILRDCDGIISWHPSAQVAGSLGAPFMRTFTENYIQGAIKQARAQFPASQYQLSIGGVISLIGSNDALRFPSDRCQGPLTIQAEHGQAYRKAIDYIRSYIASLATTPIVADDIPYLLLKTPTAFGIPVSSYYTRLAQVQNAQDFLDSSHPGTGMPMVNVIPTTLTLALYTNAHTDALGNVALGKLMATWASSVSPLLFD